jgi:hypothetical protein
MKASTHLIAEHILVNYFGDLLSEEVFHETAKNLAHYAEIIYKDSLDEPPHCSDDLDGIMERHEYEDYYGEANRLWEER